MVANLLISSENIFLVATLVLSIVTVFLVGITILLVLNVRNRIAGQKLKFHGLYSQNALTRESYAEIVVGNHALNNFGLKEIGIQNGKVRFDLTALYRVKAGLKEDERIIIQQRDSLSFIMTEEELSRCLLDGKKGKTVAKLQVYAIDSTGYMVKGGLREVRKLVVRIMKDVNSGNPPQKSPSPKPTVQEVSASVAEKPAETPATPATPAEPVHAELPAEEPATPAEPAKVSVETQETPVETQETPVETQETPAEPPAQTETDKQ